MQRARRKDIGVLIILDSCVIIWDFSDRVVRGGELFCKLSSCHETNACSALSRSRCTFLFVVFESPVIAAT